MTTRSSQRAKTVAPLLSPSSRQALEAGVKMLFHQQEEQGWWWYTLEANETIGAGILQVLHFIGDADPEIQKGLTRRMLSEQRPDGSWGIFYGAPGCLSSTIECYFS